MDGVVYATVQRDEAAQQGTVGGIDDGIHLQTGDVALPQVVASVRHPALGGTPWLQAAEDAR